MHFRKRSKIFLLCLIATNPIFYSPLLVRVHLSQGSPDFTYYGVVPSRIYRYNLTDTGDRNSLWRLDTGSVGNSSLLTIAAADDNTHVKVYNLMDNSVLDQFEINSMEKHFVLLANGTMFKVVSNNQVSVMLLNSHSIPAATARELTLPYCFYMSTDGLYVGKEFVIMGSGQGISDTDYMILALEKARVTVTKDDNTQYSYSLDANSYKNMLLSPFKVFRIESTGNIMIQSSYIAGKSGENVPCFPVPSAEGGFVGKFFLTKSLKSQEWGWDPIRDYGFRITASEDTQVKVYDLETKLEISELTIKGGSGGRFQTEAVAIAVQSDKPITLSLIHNGSIEQTATNPSITGNGMYASYGHGVLFVGIQPNEDTMIHMSTEAHIEAYFFANEETQLTIDGDIRTVHASSPLSYNLPGTHTVQSDKNVVLQINFWPLEPDYQGLEYTGAIIPCVETVNVNPEVTLVPIGEGFPIMYVVAGIAVAAVAVIMGLFVMRRRSSKPS